MDFKQFKEENEIRNAGLNLKTAVVVILLISVFIFAIVGEDNVKPLIWYWATGMSALVLVCAIQDIIIARKIKALRKARK